MRRPNGNTPTTSLRLDADLRRQVAEAAPDRALADVIREALVTWLNRREAST